MTIRLCHFGLVAVLAANIMTFPSLVAADTKQAFDGSGEQTIDDLVRSLRKEGRIDSINFMNNQITVNGVTHKIDMENTRWVSLDGRPVDHAFVEEGMRIRFGFTVNEAGEEVVSIAQITGPKSLLKELFNH